MFLHKRRSFNVICGFFRSFFYLLYFDYIKSNKNFFFIKVDATNVLLKLNYKVNTIQEDHIYHTKQYQTFYRKKWVPSRFSVFDGFYLFFFSKSGNANVKFYEHITQPFIAFLLLTVDKLMLPGMLVICRHFSEAVTADVL